jgi:hypothetical protein
MTSFDAGFVKCAEECGVSFKEALHMLKRAMEYPGTEHMFKYLDDTQGHSPEDLAALAEMFKQDLIDQNMAADKKRVQF